MINQKNIRNFCIIAHIDHGKSTLADRILEMTETVKERDMKSQILDDMDLERERGITIKLNAVQLSYHAKDGQDYLFNLIDTPGHVDFSYEVSRSLAACEGAILVVDATQGVQAQTLANTYLALDNNLEILPVINKCDMMNAQPDVVKNEIENIIGLDCSNAPLISARSGLNVDQVLEQIVEYIPSPSGDPNKPLQALVFDSFYDPYRGVIALVRIREGSIKVGDKIRFMATGAEYEVIEALLVPPLRPLSCSPPLIKGTKGTCFFFTKIPLPFNPSILCADIEAKSILSSETGTLPIACVKSTCIYAEDSFLTISFISSIGFIIPVSLFTSIIETTLVSSSNASFKSCTDTTPLSFTGKYVTRYPNVSSICLHAFKILECSICVVIICFFLGIAKETLLIASEFASLAPLVKMISSNLTFNKEAIALLAFSRFLETLVPSSYKDSLFTYVVLSNSIYAFKTSG